MPLAYYQKLMFKGYARRTPYAKNAMACHMTIWADSMLRFSSSAALFSLYLHFIPHLPFWDPFFMPITTIFLSWDPSHLPYTPSNPYAVHYITTRQGIFFLSLLLVMDAYSSSQFSHIDYISLLLIFPSLMFHDLLPLLSRMFYFVP